MEIEKHVAEFRRIVAEYELNSEEKAEEIAEFLTREHGKKISSKEFAKLFAVKAEEAEIFLSFVEKGLNFKQNVIDKK